MRRAFTLGMFLTLASAFSAHATPFTYHFNMPAWDDVNTAPSMFGNSAIFDVTVDNGNAGATGQSYLLSDIKGVSISAVGGSASLSGLGGGLQDTNHTFLTTDLSGVPTLDLLSQPGPTGAYEFHSSPQTVQLGIITTAGGYTPFYWAIGSDFAVVVGPANCNSFCGFQVVGSANTVTDIPEPITVTLFGAGLAGVVMMRRRKRASRSQA